eukprot:CAMPEP_0196761990 /NCGR_PEP_ID=MMETSP1095-20130614/1323_1 /TAXON_ID=96789 ORGANISM="Chromulina nebulosa, Strain UTEXLB2642" /NCGR_SAMPLE_ID=MMETSP1095 /ASSEMBLY_ACC=CAM_ASM_000446 /LENGTH=453 /DNA_ID=CAMNT_0042112191 /DNA_START=192 /DNA_END=1553 /DNA_ORIENTATION=+
MSQPHYNSLIDIKIPYSNKLQPTDGICSHFLRRGFTKPVKFQLNAAVWSSDARWLVLGTQSGDFALWEGETLKVHKVVSVPAHKVFTDGKVQDYVPITAMAWNHHSNSLVSGDNNGVIQYSDDSFRSSYVVREAHTAAVRGLSYSPFDSKLASCSDDGSVRIWSVGQDQPDSILPGHQSDVKCVDWHPFRALIASGSRESMVKLWDPKSGNCLSTISSHKKSIMCCQWNQNGNWLATGAKDGQVKIHDIRVMKELENLRGHNSDVCSLQWHPIHESLLLSGGYNGSLIYWLVGHNQYAHTAIGDAHRQSVDVIAWHPAGHLLATASHDCILKFWCREPPGSQLDLKPPTDFIESQPPIYGYGPLKESDNIPDVILQSSAQSVKENTNVTVQPTANVISKGTHSQNMNINQNKTNQQQNRNYQPKQQQQQQQSANIYGPASTKPNYNRKRNRDN